MNLCREIAWVPKCIPEKGNPFLIVSFARSLRREAVADFVKYCGQDWKSLKREGWRMVAVEVIG